MAAVKAYNFGTLDLIIGGFRVAGYGDDGGISIEPTSDRVTMTTGADGETTVSRTNDRSATATITVKETSDSNDVLASLLALQEATSASYALPFLLYDNETGETVASQQAIIMSVPSVGKAREAGDREWKVGLPDCVYGFAGAE